MGGQKGCSSQSCPRYCLFQLLTEETLLFHFQFLLSSHDPEDEIGDHQITLYVHMRARVSLSMKFQEALHYKVLIAIPGQAKKRLTGKGRKLTPAGQSQLQPAAGL